MREPLWRRVLFSGRSADRPALPRVLAITASTDDQAFYRKLRRERGWDIVVTATVPEALRLLAAQEFSIILCDRVFCDDEAAGSDWRDALARIVAASPGICFLLTSRVSDEYLWREVVLLGGYDVIALPLVESTVIQAVERAWYFRQTRTA